MIPLLLLAEEGGGANIPALPNIITILEHTKLPVQLLPEMFYFSLLGILVLVLPVLKLSKSLQTIPSRYQAFFEIIVEGFRKTFSSLMGSEEIAKPYVPFLSTLFLYILVLNLLGLLPLLESPTASLGMTLSLALCTFLVVQYNGFKAHGVLGYFKELAGEPIWLAPLTFPLHFMGEFIRPLSLALRLFGNILAKEILLAVLITLTPFVFGIIPLPFHIAILPLGILFAFIQALIFTFLSAIYIAGAVQGHGGGHKNHS